MSIASLAYALLCGLTSAQFCPTLHADFLRRQSEHPFNSTEPYNESHGAKHTPYITINGTKGTVTVGDGNPYHPQVPSSDPDEVHFVTHIYVLDQLGGFVSMDTIDPNDKIAQMHFDIPSGATTLVAYEWCNKHGLWKGPEAEVQPGSEEGLCTKDVVDTAAQRSFVADFHHRQKHVFNSATPFTVPNSDKESGPQNKHVPFLTIEGSTATVVVGDKTAYHPMSASDDPTTVHWITHIYAVDQNDNIVIMQNLDPNEMTTKALITFAVPDNVTSLTPFEFCNKHGLWKGPTVEIDRQNADNVDGGIMVSLGALTSFVSALVVVETF